ncbi:hypothetical protein KC19_VG076000, partial [Ceratodon purpureus]
MCDNRMIFHNGRGVFLPLRGEADVLFLCAECTDRVFSENRTLTHVPSYLDATFYYLAPLLFVNPKVVICWSSCKIDYRRIVHEITSPLD